MERFRDIQLSKLTERAKELKCMYQVIESLRDEDRDLGNIFMQIIDAIPPGWQHPTVCEVMITFEGKDYKSGDFKLTPWVQVSDIVIDNHVAGSIQICYLVNVDGLNTPFLPEEQKLLNAIADRLGMYIYVQRLKKTVDLIPSIDQQDFAEQKDTLLDYESDQHWKWRMKAAEQIAHALDLDLFGVKAIYVIGSTRNGKAGPASDIDLLIHFIGTVEQKKTLQAWLTGWGLGLSEVNYFRTGYRVEGGLVDIHMITDEDIRDSSSYAVLIESVDERARLLKTK